MDFWAGNAQPAIIAAVKAACDTIGNDFAAEIRERDNGRDALLAEEVSRRETAVSSANRLEEENRSLLRELQALRKKTQPASRPGYPVSSGDHDVSGAASMDSENAPRAPLHLTPRQVLGETSPNKGAGTEKLDWKKDFQKLAKRYTALEERLIKTQAAARKIREERGRWMKYSEKLEVKVKKLEERLQISTLAQGQPSTPATANSTPGTRAKSGICDAAYDAAETDHGDNFAGETTHNMSFIPNPESGTRSKTGESWLPKRASWTPPDALPQLNLRHVQNHRPVLDDVLEANRPDDLPPISHNIDAGHHVAIKPEPSSDSPVIVSERNLRKRRHVDDHGTPPPTRKIKNEQSRSSDLVVAGEQIGFSPHESLDLDASQDAIPTPKKQRLTAQRQPLLSDAIPRDRAIHSNDGVVNASVIRAKLNGPDVRTPGKLTPAQGENNGASTALKGITSALRSSDESSRIYAGRRLYSDSDWSLNHGVADVAEETFETFHSPRARPIADPSNQAPLKEGRLHSLLNQPTAETDSILLRRPRPGDSAIASVESPPNKQLKNSKATSKTFTMSGGSHNTPSIRRAQGNANGSKNTPLRERQLADLRAEDFKINPKFNNGYNHAYDEVVRNKADRTELAGCIEPNCCGKQYRAMAESELRATGALIPYRAKDIELLEAFLGNEAYRLSAIPREEQQKLWVDAKIRDLANKYGKHRHRFVRKPSPPGFWNPDFPSTQEIADRKEEGEKLERELLKARRQEAMRGGGRWLFRDE
ncbi:DNA repair protein endonuclease SAE2/CtIP C-terminus-domain-containing protein [Podospora didyma]|uniref:DNA repair protein endonuclease SAE2/CtIP C-terminus-domain-containing protein n=1 Tax=Podospora didyma TaxID=330526 RepID=A0AAE0KK30_9PEZI|nr:DNA repair protein endonuclease SAE2/CtIP C-terminus-domain-containing protein [Podospora didyma]